LRSPIAGGRYIDHVGDEEQSGGDFSELKEWEDMSHGQNWVL
jgi:hypothetical protein